MLGVLLHVTVERRNLDRWCSETATADSGKQGRWRAGHLPLDLSRGATMWRCVFI